MTPTTRPIGGSKDLLWTLIERHVRLRLKRSWMGIIWPTAFPFLLAVLYVYVFRRVLNVPIPHYFDYLMCGLIPWVFFQQAATRGMASISSEPEIITRAPFPYGLLPISAVATHALNLLLAMVIFVGYVGVAGRLEPQLLPFLLVPLTSMVLFTMAFTMILALVDVYNQDVRHALPVVLTVWFFLIPIVYQARMAPTVVRTILAPEPIHLVVGQIRAVLYRGTVPKVDEMVLLLLVSAVSFAIASAAFHRASAHLPADV